MGEGDCWMMLGVLFVFVLDVLVSKADCWGCKMLLRNFRLIFFLGRFGRVFSSRFCVLGSRFF